MRLNKIEVEAIKTAFAEVFGDGKVYLFGSRVDDSKRGGDIDLYLALSEHGDLFEKKIRFLSKIKRRLGEQKIDVIFNQDENRLIEQEAIRSGVEL